MNTITYGHKVAGAGIEPIPPYRLRRLQSWVLCHLGHQYLHRMFLRLDRSSICLSSRCDMILRSHVPQHKFFWCFSSVFCCSGVLFIMLIPFGLPCLSLQKINLRNFPHFDVTNTLSIMDQLNLLPEKSGRKTLSSGRNHIARGRSCCDGRGVGFVCQGVVCE